MPPSSFNLDPNFASNPKIRRLCKELGDAGLSCLFRLWAYGTRVAWDKDGELRDHDAGMIEEECEWTGADGVLLAAMLKYRLLEPIENGYRIPNFVDNNPHFASSAGFYEKKSLAGKISAEKRKKKHDDLVQQNAILVEQAAQQNATSVQQNANVLNTGEMCSTLVATKQPFVQPIPNHTKPNHVSANQPPKPPKGDGQLNEDEELDLGQTGRREPPTPFTPPGGVVSLSEMDQTARGLAERFGEAYRGEGGRNKPHVERDSHVMQSLLDAGFPPALILDRIRAPGRIKSQSIGEFRVWFSKQDQATQHRPSKPETPLERAKREALEREAAANAKAGAT